ncbi:hypothetical protein SCLCIDRAFT_751757 [Scleroderma citrinum Foug A]|uniref:Uncharacterized protein n=1 Tax=Scleroderma citrinum Foug A TaxID=1036808 RepID=A0A0C3CQH9_9AGAM|nr:hypothetical protein SCLCIDRAFT_751757 [Scleroderma citrinum Foug A]
MRPVSLSTTPRLFCDHLSGVPTHTVSFDAIQVLSSLLAGCCSRTSSLQASARLSARCTPRVSRKGGVTALLDTKPNEGTPSALYDSQFCGKG